VGAAAVVYPGVLAPAEDLRPLVAVWRGVLNGESRSALCDPGGPEEVMRMVPASGVDPVASEALCTGETT